MQQTLELSLSQAAGQIDQHLRAHRWQSAAEALAVTPRRSSQAEFRLRLARNLAAIAEHRPDLYRVLKPALESSGEPFAIVRGKFGRWTVGSEHASDRVLDPISSTLQTLSEIKPAWKSGKAMALCGLGDGYVLSALAEFSPVLLLGREQAIYIIEPRAELVLTLLMLHDYSGPNGPIRQQRFFWFIGPDWAEQFRQTFLGEPLLHFPSAQIGQGPDVAEMDSVLRKTSQELLALDQEQARRIEELYAHVTAGELARLFGDNPPRRPRVLLTTSRFTTVLQYSTADAAEVLAKLGWETRTLIETEPFHSPRKSAVRRAILEFRPDLVLIIDHLRQEHDGVYPANLPFACWIQDHLPLLCNTQAGESIQARDFVLTAIGTHFVQMHHYPARQIVDLPNLARIPQRPKNWKSDGLDLIYISNWTRTTDQVIEEIYNRTAKPPELRAVAQCAVTRMLAVYDRGDFLATQHEVRAIIQQAQLDAGLAIADPDLADDLVNFFWHRLNNHLYRHQALGWVAELVERKNLSFGLYGRGWETHPRLWRFARGFVKPGEDLENLVRQSRMNLQLEPFACFTHPRLLTGLFAGGFFLIRDHPFNHLPQRLLDFLSANLPDDVETVTQAREAIALDRRQALESILGECAAMSEQADPIQMSRNWQRAGLILPEENCAGHLAEIIFSNPAGLERNVVRFAADEELRRRVADNLRRELEGRLSYEAGFKSAIRRIGQLLGAQA
jgi:hypothetical protein